MRSRLTLKEALAMSREQLDAWMADLTDAELDAWLIQVSTGPGEPDQPDVDMPPAVPLAPDDPDVRGPPGKGNRPPRASGQAADQHREYVHRQDSPEPPVSQLRCGGCGAAGRVATLVWDRSAPADPRPIVRPVFGFDPSRPGPVLLCDRCRSAFHRRILKRGRRL